MKKLRTFFFSMLPCFLAIILQFFLSFSLMLLSAGFVFLTMLNNSPDDKWNHLMELWGNTNFNTIIMILFSISCIILFSFWYRETFDKDFLSKSKKKFHLLQIIGIIFLVPATQFMSALLVSILSIFFPNWLIAYETLLENAGLTEDISIIMMIYSVCLAPISEELIFRGVTMRIARKSFPFWIANIMQALFFGIFHLNILQGCYAFALGLFLGYVYEHSGSIYHAIFFHFLFNLWGTTISGWLTTLNPAFTGILICFGTTIGMSVGLKLFRLGTKKLLCTDEHNIT